MQKFYCFLVLLCLCSTLSAAGALGKPRYKKEIAFNEVLRLEFSTLLPETKQADIAATIVNAMDMSNNRENWHLLEAPAVVVNDKSRYVKIQMRLMPRQTGSLRLPEIPLNWLEDNSIPNLGDVQVREVIVIGNHSKELPSEIVSVGGFTWKMPEAELINKLGKSNAKPIKKDGEKIYITDSGLELVVREKQLTAARIRAKPGWYLRQARYNFIDRWGEPRINGLNSEKPYLTWIIGWLRIQAHEEMHDGKPQVIVHIKREDVDSSILTNSVNNQVFDLLEKDQTTDELWNKDDKKNNEEENPKESRDNDLGRQDKPQKSAPPREQASNNKEDKASKAKEEKESSIDPAMLEALYREAAENKQK